MIVSPYLRSFRTQALAALLLVLLAPLLAQEAPAAPEPPKEPAMLPQRHPWQKVLRDYMATLTEADLTHGVDKPLAEVPGKDDPEYRLRNYIFHLMVQPIVGNKRGAPAINAPPRTFLLPDIEGGEQVMRVNTWPETLIALVLWDYEGNVFHQNRALKLRCFVAATINLLMTDAYHEDHPTGYRSDWHAYQLSIIAMPYPGFREVLPKPVQEAYETGLRRLGDRFLALGIKGEAHEQDAILPFSLWYIAQCLKDPEFSAKVEALGREWFTSPRTFNPAGYWVERGGLDTGFAGQANFFSTGLALATGWDFARDAIARIYRLRAHLMFPEPNGRFDGPSAFNARLGSPVSNDQWAWNGTREWAATMLTDEAVFMAPAPTPELLAASGAKRANSFNFDVKENPRVRTNYYLKNEEITNHPWQFRMWVSYNFPASINYAYEFYRPGTWEKYAKLVAADSPLLKSPYLRGELFLRDFGGHFYATRQAGYGALLHTGPVASSQPDDGMVQFPGPMGLGGGQLAGFWTPATGGVIYNRRRGMNANDTRDKLEDWRLWPIHAVSGITSAGKPFSSARLITPEASAELKGHAGTIKVGGVLPATTLGAEPSLTGTLDYRREFVIGPQNLRVTTTVTGDGADTFAELLETIPLFFRDARAEPNTKVTVSFQVGGQWRAAEHAFVAAVQAVRIERHEGQVVITFAQPQRLRLTSDTEEWTDNFLSRAVCRNLIIDLLNSADKPLALKGPRSVSYTIAPGP